MRCSAGECQWHCRREYCLPSIWIDPASPTHSTCVITHHIQLAIEPIFFLNTILYLNLHSLTTILLWIFKINVLNFISFKSYWRIKSVHSNHYLHCLKDTEPYHYQCVLGILAYSSHFIWKLSLGSEYDLVEVVIFFFF